MADSNQLEAPASERSQPVDSSSDSSSSAMAVKSRPRPRRAPPRVDRLPPWRVLLHNDDVNDIGYVVETIIELMRLNPRIALMQTLTAHQRGLALLATTHREHAELLQDQFQSKSLTVTIEPEA